MTILKDIIEWVKDKPSFWQIAIDRLIRNNQLTQKDLVELKEICKVEVGLSKYQFTPVDFNSLRIFTNSSIGKKNLMLSRIYDIENINALSNNSILEFALNGLTVIYGDNGAGKSSYVSILKYGCNTRGKKPVINDNIFDPNSAGKDKKAKIEYTSDKINFDFTELINQQVDNLILKSVDVFDTYSADHYIEGEDEIAFIPQGLSILEKLALSINKIESELEQEINQTELSKFNLSLLQLSLGTKAKLFVDLINHKTELDALRSHSNYTKEKGDRILELNKIIPKLKATDPRQKIKENNDKNQRFLVLQNKLNNIEKLFSNEALEKIKVSINDYVDAGNTLKATTDKLFSNLPIEGVGSDSWKSLWESARSFFNEYQGAETFPNTVEDSSCPLCLQPLGLEANERFNGFEAFVKDDVQKKYDNCLTQYNKVVDVIEKISFDFEEQLPIIEELDKSIENFKGTFEEYVSTLTNQRDSIKSILNAKLKVTEITHLEIKTNARNLITNQIEKLSDSNKNLNSQSIEKKLKPLEDELSELLDEKKLFDFKPKLAREIYRQKKINLLQNCKKKCNTRLLTTISNQLTSTYISQNLKDSFKEELRKLGFHNIKIEAETKGKKGKQYHYLRLDEANTNKVALKDILSEGEHRCISLATFLSELAISDHSSAIIFDDPVSSLDHKWRNKIAKRIAEESLKRQVIVFTHDITFLQMIQETSKEFNCDLEIRSLTRKKTETGLIASNPPWDALSVKKRIGILKADQQELAKIERTETEEVYKDKIKPLYGKLRETWERFVEEVLLDCTVQRYNRAIQTQRIKKIIDISIDDYNLIDANMSKCSTYFLGHDSAGALIEEMPDSVEFLEDVKQIEDLTRLIRARRN